MPTFLWFYVAGLAASVAVGFVFYYLLGGSVEPTFAKVFGERAGHVWGRSFRMMVVTIALVGGLSTQWYGCEGYADRKAVERSREVMFEKSNDQVASAISYANWFVIGVAGLCAIMYAILWRRGDDAARPLVVLPNKKDVPDPTVEAQP